MNRIEEKIKHLRRERNAVILAHNYQMPGVQDIADFVGDSLALAMKAKETDADVIVFCGVDFMAESAKIVNPDKIVLHPDMGAKCPMAAMVDIGKLKALKSRHKNAAVVSYVNTTAEVKAVSNICCTSANAVKIVKSMEEKDIIFIPDSNLGKYVKRFVNDKNMILWPGFCPTHHKIEREDVMSLKRKHPGAEIIAHPECRPEVVDAADFVYSTGGMIKHARNSGARKFIIATEKEMCYRLKKEMPEKEFYCIEHAICPNMKKITLEKVLKSLETLTPEMKLSDDVIKKARIPLERMINMGRGD